VDHTDTYSVRCYNKTRPYIQMSNIRLASTLN